MRTSEFQTKISKYALDGLMGGLMDDIFIEVCPHIIKNKVHKHPPKCHFLTGFYIPYIKHKTLNINNINLSFCTQIL